MGVKGAVILMWVSLGLAVATIAVAPFWLTMALLLGTFVVGVWLLNTGRV